MLFVVDNLSTFQELWYIYEKKYFFQTLVKFLWKRGNLIILCILSIRHFQKRTKAQKRKVSVFKVVELFFLALVLCVCVCSVCAFCSLSYRDILQATHVRTCLAHVGLSGVQSVVCFITYFSHFFPFVFSPSLIPFSFLFDEDEWWQGILSEIWLGAQCLYQTSSYFSVTCLSCAPFCLRRKETEHCFQRFCPRMAVCVRVRLRACMRVCVCKCVRCLLFGECASAHISCSISGSARMSQLFWASMSHYSTPQQDTHRVTQTFSFSFFPLRLISLTVTCSLLMSL